MPTSGGALASEGGDPADQAGLAAAYGQLPLSFEANQGQTDASVDFLAHGQGYTLLLSVGEAVLSLQPPSPSSATRDLATADQATNVLRLQLVGADAHPQVVAQQPLPGTANYLLGNDPSQWHTGIPTYAQVQYRAVYPGVDLVYHGQQGQLEYDFVVAPGASPGSIRLAPEGTEQLELAPEGDLVLHTTAGELRQPKPLLYQDTDRGRQTIEGGYVLGEQPEVGFWVGAYDPSRPLTIDPVLVYSTYLGGSGIDEANAIAVDGAGAAYIAGVTESADFPTTSGEFQPRFQGGDDAFVSKLNPNGTALVYSTYLGGRSVDFAYGIAVDATGNAYVAGSTASADFPTTPGAFQTHVASLYDGFVTKLNPSGTALVYSTYLGGSGYDAASAIAVDRAGDTYLTGNTASVDFPITPGAFQPMLHGGPPGTPYDAFVTELNASGTALVYSTYLGGTDIDSGTGIAVDSASNVYVSGYTSSSQFPTTSGAFQTTRRGGTVDDAFLSKLNASGTALVYSTYLGGSGPNARTEVNAIALDATGNAYVAGRTSSADFPTTPGAFQRMLASPGDLNGFVSKLNASGAALVYSTFLGGSGIDQANAIAVDDAGNAHIAGTTGSVDFPITPGAFQPTLHGGPPGTPYDAFVTELNASGAALVYSTYLGGSGYDAASAIAVDDTGNTYVTGSTTSANFPMTSGAFQPIFRGGPTVPIDGFAVRIDSQSVASPPTTTAALTPSPNAAGWNRSNVTVTLAATAASGGAPVQSITYSASGAQTIPGTTVPGSTATVPITAEGVTMLSYFATDQAGTQEQPKMLVVRIDTTPPEAFAQFDPTKQDLLVFGKDAGSGVPAGPIAPSSVAPSSWSPGDDGADAKPDGNDHSAELRTYPITDLAGNTTTLVLKVQGPGPHGDQLKARLVSIQYGSTPAVTFALNSEEFHWDLAKDGTLAKLDQQVRIGTGPEQQAIDAHFEARQGYTELRVKSPPPQRVLRKPGLDLLQIVTAKGQLSIAY